MDLFLRNGVKHIGDYSDNGKGKKGFCQLKKCHRCGGAGGADKWKFTGWTCFECGGLGNLGYEFIRIYTAAELEKLNTRAAKAAEKREAKKQIEAEQKRVAAAARQNEFLSVYGDLLDRAEKYAGYKFKNGMFSSSGWFLKDVCEKARINNTLTEKQATALEEAIIKTAEEIAAWEKQEKEFLAENGELIKEAEIYAAENDFIKSLVKQARAYFSLSAKQIYYLKKAVKKEHKQSGIA